MEGLLDLGQILEIKGHCEVDFITWPLQNVTGGNYFFSACTQLGQHFY